MSTAAGFSELELRTLVVPRATSMAVMRLFATHSLYWDQHAPWSTYRLDRPENQGLKPYFGKLEKAKSAIDSKSKSSGRSLGGSLPGRIQLLALRQDTDLMPVGIEPISYADLEVMGLKVATKLLWTSIKVGQPPASAKKIASKMPVALHRICQSRFSMVFCHDALVPQRWSILISR